MPFWQKIKRCENCQFFRRRDVSDTAGTCEWRPERAPGWYGPAAHMPVTYDYGTECDAYRHLKEKDRTHPLDFARPFLATANKGDTIPMRTYDIGEVSRATAVVEQHGRSFVAVRFLNGLYRIRLEPTDREHGGTIIGMERWGVDTGGTIVRGETFTAHPDRAEPMLAKVKAGEFIPLIGYPPFDGQRRQAMVLRVQPNRLQIKLGRRKAWMHRRGELAGVIEGDVYVLDTTEDTHGSETQATPEREAVAEGDDTV